MVLDPFTAIGLAANVVQFIDYGSKLISNGLELYRNGILLEQGQLRDQASQLQDFNDVLIIRLKEIDKSDSPQARPRVHKSHKPKVKDDEPSPPDDPLVRLLRVAVEHCSLCAVQVVNAVGKLTVSGSHAKWQSFRHALSSTIGDSGLAIANQRLSEAQQNVTLFLILYTRYDTPVSKWDYGLSVYKLSTNRHFLHHRLKL